MLVIHLNRKQFLHGPEKGGLTENWDWNGYLETFNNIPRICMYHQIDAQLMLTTAVPRVNLEL